MVRHGSGPVIDHQHLLSQLPQVSRGRGLQCVIRGRRQARTEGRRDPGGQGPSLVKKVRADRPSLRVIFISGYAEDSFRKRLGEEPDIHFLAKPYTLRELAGKVKEVMGEEHV